MLQNGTRVPKPASQLQNTLQNGTFGAKSGFTTSQCVSQLRNRCSCAAKWHSCAKSAFAAAKSYAKWDFCCQKNEFFFFGFRSCEMALVCQKLASQLRNTLPNGAFPAKLRISCFGGSQPLSQLRNGGSCAAKWHSCAKVGFAAAKIFAERAIGL